MYVHISILDKYCKLEVILILEPVETLFSVSVKKFNQQIIFFTWIIGLLQFNYWKSRERAKMGIFCLETAHSNCLPGCPLLPDKVTTTKRRGCLQETEMKTYTNTFQIIKWFDRRSVVLLTTFSLARQLGKVDRWGKAKREHVPIDFPNAITTYNKG